MAVAAAMTTSASGVSGDPPRIKILDVLNPSDPRIQALLTAAGAASSSSKDVSDGFSRSIFLQEHTVPRKRTDAVLYYTGGGNPLAGGAEEEEQSRQQQQRALRQSQIALDGTIKPSSVSTVAADPKARPTPGNTLKRPLTGQPTAKTALGGELSISSTSSSASAVVEIRDSDDESDGNGRREGQALSKESGQLVSRPDGMESMRGVAACGAAEGDVEESVRLEPIDGDSDGDVLQVIVLTHADVIHDRYDVFEELEPAAVVLYDSDLRIVRLLETYQASPPTQPSPPTPSPPLSRPSPCRRACKVYLLMYGA